MFYGTIAQLAGFIKLQQYTVCGYINLGMFFIFVTSDEAAVFYEVCPTYFSDIISLIPKLPLLTFSLGGIMNL